MGTVGGGGVQLGLGVVGFGVIAWFHRVFALLPLPWRLAVSSTGRFLCLGSRQISLAMDFLLLEGSKVNKLSLGSRLVGTMKRS